MKLLCQITDKEILGREGMSKKPPRLTARAIVRNCEGAYAVMYAAKFGLHSLPGGGIEDGEDPLYALRREILEETGCTCDHIEELGIISENRAHQDFTAQSYYYVVTTEQSATPIHLTDDERANQTTVQWHSLEEVIRLISRPKHTTTQRMYLQARDMAALKEYMTRTQQGQTMEWFYKMAQVSNRRFPKGVEPYQMATRLLEECGEIAAEINLWEDSGIKRQKHGCPKKENIANEIRQAMVELVKIARYYQVEKEPEASISASLEKSMKEGLIE